MSPVESNSQQNSLLSYCYLDLLEVDMKPLFPSSSTISVRKTNRDANVWIDRLLSRLLTHPSLFYDCLLQRLVTNIDGTPVRSHAGSFAVSLDQEYLWKLEVGNSITLKILYTKPCGLKSYKLTKYTVFEYIPWGRLEGCSMKLQRNIAPVESELLFQLLNSRSCCSLVCISCGNQCRIW